MLGVFEPVRVESHRLEYGALEGRGFGRNYSVENGKGGPFANRLFDNLSWCLRLVNNGFGGLNGVWGAATVFRATIARNGAVPDKDALSRIPTGISGTL